MERIKEEIFNRKYDISKKDPYPLALDILAFSKQFGKVVEKKNRFVTTGPRKKCEVLFMLEKNLDKFSKYQLIFNMNGESGIDKLEILIKGDFIATVSGNGFTKQVFFEHYRDRIMPKLKRISEKEVRDIVDKIQNRFLR